MSLWGGAGLQLPLPRLCLPPLLKIWLAPLPQGKAEMMTLQGGGSDLPIISFEDVVCQGKDYQK